MMIRKNDFVEITVWGKTKRCIVIKGANISKGTNTKSSVVLTDIKSSKGLKIRYPLSYISKIKKLNKKDLLFYINLDNRYIRSVISELYGGKEYAML